jgi:predicted flap endonuclease-1-like 5' DNA nuclease
MTSFVVLFVSLAALAVGVYAGWALRSRMDAPSSDDPEAELRALREIHGGCATRIRNLHLELAQLETKLSMSRIDGPPRPSPASVTEDDLAGAARLASLMDVLESGTESDQTAGDEEVDHPAAFMSILPADLVESQSVREVAQEPPAPISEVAVEVAGEAAASASVAETAAPASPDLVIALAGDDTVIEIETTGPDQLTLIKGIGPKIEAILHQQGITTFRQIAELDEFQIEALGEALGSFRGRIVRDDWVGAARQMVGATAGR